MNTAGKPVLFVLWLLFLTTLGWGQKREPPRYRVAVELVTLDVVVTDKSGNCPKDLRAEEFEVFEDGIRQQIQDFQLVLPPTQGPAVSPAIRKPAGAKPAAPAQPPQTGMVGAAGSIPLDPRLFLLVIDNLNSQWINLVRMRSDIEAFISETIQRDDMMAILTAGHSVRLLQSFTNDRQALQTAARKALDHSFEGTVAEAERSSARMAALDAAKEEVSDPDYAFDMFMQMVRTYSQLNDYGSRNALSTIKALCERLAPLKGRKTIVLVSEGFGITGPVEHVLARAVGAANKANTSVYCIHPGGLNTSDLVRAQYNEENPTVSLRQNARTRTFQTTGRAAGGNTALDAWPIEQQANAGDDGLNEIALKTGGLVFRKTNDYRKAIEAAWRDSREYYLLTYVPANQVRDERFRKIDVRLKRKGYDLRARAGYYPSDRATGFAGSIDEQMSQVLFSPQLLTELSTALAPAGFLDPSGEAVVCLTFHLSYRGTTLAESAGRYAGDFTLIGGVFNEGGTLVHNFKEECPLNFDQGGYDNFREHGSSLVIRFTLPPGRYQVKTVLREKDSGRMGSRREEFNLQPRQGESVLSSIVLSDHVYPAEAAAKAGLALQGFNPFLYRNVLIAPAAERTFSREGSLTFFFHVYRGAEDRPIPLGTYVYRLSLYRDGSLYYRSQFTPLRNSAQPIPNGFMLALQLPLSKLAPGSYQGEVEIAPPDGSGREARTVSFEVK